MHHDLPSPQPATSAQNREAAMTLQQCDCLSAVGMSVECLDSYCPSHHKCDHVIKPSCWGASHSNIVTDRDKVLDELVKMVSKRCGCNQDIEHADIPIIHVDELAEIITELRTTPTPEDEFRCKQCGRFSEECECEESPTPEQS